MKTEIIKENIERAAELIRAGELVGVPTETVYGLAGNGLDAAAVEKIYEVKGRPAVKALALMVPDDSAMEKYCEDVPESAHYLAEKFWPGPLTIILKSKDTVPDIVRAGGLTVGLRCPDHKMTLEALKICGLPFAAPSANPSGEPSPKTSEDVMRYFDGKISAVIDGGECGIGRESTIISMSEKPYKILRQGALPRECIASALAEKLTIVGVTGGTGSGKTSALDVLKEMGALVIDCDAVYHELLEKSDEMINDIGRLFPDAVKNGRLDRKALGRVVFSDSAALERLNTVTHYHIGAEVDRMLNNWAMEGGTLAAVDAIALLESGLSDKCRFTVGVTADKEVRIKRIMQRDNIDRRYAEMRIEAQKPDSYFEKHCDYIIENNGSVDEFKERCKKYFAEVLL